MNLLSVLLYPFKETYTAYSLYYFEESADIQRIQIENQSAEKKIDKIALKTIRDFLKKTERKSEKAFNAELIIINENDNKNDNSASITCFGSQIVIKLPKLTFEEAKTGKLCDSCKFLITHELGHIVNDDKVTSKNLALQHSINVLIFFISLCISYSYPLACIFSKISSLAAHFFRRLKNRQKEYEADKFALKTGSQEIAFGAYFYFFNESTLNRCSRNASWSNYFRYTKDGNSRTDLAHPPITERMYRITKADEFQDRAKKIINSYYDKDNREWVFPKHSVTKENSSK